MQLCLRWLQQQQVGGSRKPSDFGSDSQLSSLRVSESEEISYPLQTPLAAQLSAILEGDELQRTLGRVSKATDASLCLIQRHDWAARAAEGAPGNDETLLHHYVQEGLLLCSCLREALACTGVLASA